MRIGPQGSFFYRTDPVNAVKEFEETIGVKYLCGMHLNDSKTPAGSKRDRHENIGLYVISYSPTSPINIPHTHLRRAPRAQSSLIHVTFFGNDVCV